MEIATRAMPSTQEGQLSESMRLRVSSITSSSKTRGYFKKQEQESKSLIPATSQVGKSG